MHVIVMRHGEAEGFATQGDRSRHLTTHGQEQARRAGEYFSANYKLRKVITSDYFRAHETAELASTGAPVEVTSDLGLSKTNLEAVCAQVRNLHLEDPSADDCVLLVSHIPLVYMLYDQFAKGGMFNGHTAGFAVIDVETGKVVDDSSSVPRR